MANFDAYSAAESWIKQNIIEDHTQQLPKHGCYMAYVTCMLNNNILTITNSDFGKILKNQHGHVQTRRLGPRGSTSNYYSGITLSRSSIPGNPSSYQIPPPSYEQALVPNQQPPPSYEQVLVPYRQPPPSYEQVLVPPELSETSKAARPGVQASASSILNIFFTLVAMLCILLLKSWSLVGCSSSILA